MVHPVLFGIATGIGLLTDKYMLEATNFVEHYATNMEPNDHQKNFIKSAMYAGAICGMVIFGPLSDSLGRRFCLILCSVITLAGALLSMCAWDAHVLIIARIITGIGMGGEYPLASTHSADSSKSADDGARNVALLYLFGSGGGPVLCDLVTYILDVAGVPGPYLWRCIFLVGSLLSLVGLILRIYITRDSKKIMKSISSKSVDDRRIVLSYYWKPLLGSSLIWCLFDIVEYGLKQNDAAIFADDENAPYSQSVLTVMCTRLLVIPSLAVAPMLLTAFSSKTVQVVGFVGCLVTNALLSASYEELHNMSILFDAVYIVQLSFQSLPGVTTMAIPAEIFPVSVKGTAAAISAASGKVGAVVGSYYFTMMKNHGNIKGIFTVVTCTSLAALALTLLLQPLYNGATLEKAQLLANQGQPGKAIQMLYSGPQENDEIEAIREASAEEESASNEEDQTGSSGSGSVHE